MQAIFFMSYTIDETNDTTHYDIARRAITTDTSHDYATHAQSDDVLLMRVSISEETKISLTGEATREEQEVLGDLFEMMRYENDDWSDFIFEYDS